MRNVLIADKMSPLAHETLIKEGVTADIKTGLDEKSLIEIIGDYDGLAVRSATKVNAKVIEAGKKGKLKIIGRAGIGIDNIDKEAATQAGIIVMNTPFGNSITTAEHAVSMLMALARQIPLANQSTHAGKWEKSKFMGVEIRGKTLGLVGAGNVGSIVAGLAQGLKMRVIAYDPFLNDARAKELNVKNVGFDELLAQSDFISIHTPLNDQTRYLFDENAFRKCRKNLRIINCARGGIIDEAALASALDEGLIAGAALDVFEEEPATKSVIFNRNDVICTPHLGASTIEAQEKVAVQLAEQMASYLQEGAIINAINMPSISAEEAPILKAYMRLAMDMGSFIGQITQSSYTQVKISFCGKATTINTIPVRQAMLASLLEHSMHDVNMINAEKMAEQRDIIVTEEKTGHCDDYHQLLKLSVTTKNKENIIWGTLYGNDLPRIVLINDIKVELGFSGNMLYIENKDKPGLVGQLGMTIGAAGLNIATFDLGRSAVGKTAVAILSLDASPNRELLKNILEIPLVTKAKALFFGSS